MERVLRLQATAGNAAVATMLAREPLPYGPALDPYLPEPPGAQPPAWATDDLRRKLAAVVLAESGPGQEDKVRWIYLERVTRAGGEKGLEGSSAYDQGIRYRLYLYTLGDPSHGDDPLPDEEQFKGYTTIADYCTRNRWWLKERKPRAERLRGLVDEMIAAPAANPHPGWVGQGSLKDFNNESNQDVYWTKARAYYWMQERGEVKDVYVEILPPQPPGQLTTVIFDADAIKAYFDAHPDKLPSQVPKYRPPP